MVDTTNDTCARATVAVTSAKKDVEAASRYESRTRSPTVHRWSVTHARLTESTSIKASDFFDAAASAWAAVESVTESISAARNYSTTAAREAQMGRRRVCRLSQRIVKAIRI
jgi:hypothetical protein